jgi:GH35 family endo-1,4-beta-xylanase
MKQTVISFLLLTAIFFQVQGQEPINFKDATTLQKSNKTDAEWKAEANARIEKYRKEDVIIHITQNGKPIKGATVKIDMTDNEFRFGSNIFAWSDADTPEAAAYRNLFAGLLNFATLGFYWNDDWEPEKGKPNYAGTKQRADWCKANGIHGKGHPLMWNTGEPHWVKDISEEELYEAQIGRTHDCVEYFKETIDTWDVVNEMVGWDREKYWMYAPRLTSLVNNNKGKVPFSKAGFEAARKGNPNATLLINDWMVDDRYEDLLKHLTDENGQPIYDAIGIQSHMHSSGPWSNDTILYLCDKFAKFGKPIHFTEVTILSTYEKRDWGSQRETIQTDPEGEEYQRANVERFYTMVFSHPATGAITWWDFTDKNAWRFAPSGLIRADMTPKPAYTALKKLIKEDWETHTTIKTDKSGVAKVRAFRGTYTFTVTLPNGKKVVKTFSDTVAKDKTTFELNVEK